MKQENENEIEREREREREKMREASMALGGNLTSLHFR